MGWLLGIGIFLLPYIFVWWLLRKGHTIAARVLGFGWLAVMLVVGLAKNDPVSTTGVGSVGSVRQAPDVERDPAAEAAAEQRRADAARARDLKYSPEKFLELEEAIGGKGGFDTIFMLSGSIANSSDTEIKDPIIKCDLFGPSGTQVGSVKETLYEIIPAEGSKRFSELSMGFMGSAQVDGHKCYIVKAVAGP